MTHAEFTSWITKHYGELFAVARRRTNTDEEAADAVQGAVARVLSTRSYETVRHPWTYFVNAVRSVAATNRRSAARGRAAQQGLRRELRAGVSQGWKRPAPRAE